MQAFLPPKLQLLKGPVESFNEAHAQRLLDVMWDAPTLPQLRYMVLNGNLLAYETPAGLILLETYDWAKGRELHIYGMAGSDILSHGKVIVEDLKALAAHYGCSMIGGSGVPKGWMRAAPALGFQPIYTHYVMELTHGRA